MAREKVQRNPSPYPRVLFHAIRIIQFFCSVVVAGQLGAFVWYLQDDGYAVPFTFIVLLAVSAFTTVHVFVTAFFYHFRTLRPKLSSVFNAALFIMWATGTGLLIWWISPLLTHKCDIKNWSGWEGIMVCRMYKAVASFAIVGTLSTLASFILDIVTLRKAHARGKYNVMRDLKPQLRPFHRVDDDFSDRLVPEDTNQYGRASHSRSASADARDMRRPYRTQEPLDAGSFGYNHPSEQTTYEGAGGRALDRAFAREGA